VLNFPDRYKALAQFKTFLKDFSISYTIRSNLIKKMGLGTKTIVLLGIFSIALGAQTSIIGAIVVADTTPESIMASIKSLGFWEHSYIQIQCKTVLISTND
jgi:hypothetical protein